MARRIVMYDICDECRRLGYDDVLGSSLYEITIQQVSVDERGGRKPIGRASKAVADKPPVAFCPVHEGELVEPLARLLGFTIAPLVPLVISGSVQEAVAEALPRLRVNVAPGALLNPSPAELPELPAALPKSPVLAVVPKPSPPPTRNANVRQATQPASGRGSASPAPDSPRPIVALAAKPTPYLVAAAVRFVCEECGQEMPNSERKTHSWNHHKLAPNQLPWTALDPERTWWCTAGKCGNSPAKGGHPIVRDPSGVTRHFSSHPGFTAPLLEEQERNALWDCLTCECPVKDKDRWDHAGKRHDKQMYELAWGDAAELAIWRCVHPDCRIADARGFAMRATMRQITGHLRAPHGIEDKEARTGLAARTAGWSAAGQMTWNHLEWV